MKNLKSIWIFIFIFSVFLHPLAYSQMGSTFFQSEFKSRWIDLFNPLGVHQLQFHAKETIIPIIVTNTNDTASGSLRDAIDQANSSAGPDSIIFNIPTSDPGFDAVIGVWTIKPQSPLPIITDDTLYIHGSSQTQFVGDFNPYGPEIQLDGSEVVGSPSHGLFIISGMNSIQGLIINRFNHSGILLSGPSANDNLLVNNYIGVNAVADDVLPNGDYGVYIVEGARNSIGSFPTETNTETTARMKKQIKKITENMKQTSIMPERV